MQALGINISYFFLQIVFVYILPVALIIFLVIRGSEHTKRKKQLQEIDPIEINPIEKTPDDIWV